MIEVITITTIKKQKRVEDRVDSDVVIDKFE